MKKKNVVKVICNEVGVSQCALAQWFGCSQILIEKWFKEAGMAVQKTKNTPQVTEKQEKVQKASICGSSSGIMSSTSMLEIVLDYESSFTYSESEIPGNADFNTGPGGDVAVEVEFKSKAKFQKRLMV